MHEAGLAASIAETLRRHGLDAKGPPIRLIVRGGHSAEAAFDDALRLHLELSLPNLDVGRVTIVHQPREATCVACGATFAAAALDSSCPICGGPGLSRPTPESVDVEWTGSA
jgi:Zn finger protein HypA/HybF involved in hydrogenase expression